MTTATGAHAQANPLIQRGRAWVFGDDVPNDAGVMTIEATRRSIYDPAELAKHCMRAIDPDFPERARPGDFIVAGRNFGRGQLHVQGPLSIGALGLGLVTESMSRSFFRLCVSVGVKMLPFCASVREGIGSGDEIEVDFSAGRVRNLSTGREFAFEPLPDFILEILLAGGERPWLAKQAQP
ncbi:MAG: 3-isopropylmalate dehydratase [Burkholderiales bacterium]|mgnify:FL=1|nr:3-isopropylmalate dehydratase [Burkholderiales bacterium]